MATGEQINENQDSSGESSPAAVVSSLDNWSIEYCSRWWPVRYTKADLERHRLRLEAGRCPVHDRHFVPRVLPRPERDLLRARTLGARFVYCKDSYPECPLIVRAYSSTGPFELVPKWRHLLVEPGSAEPESGWCCDGCAGLGVVPCNHCCDPVEVFECRRCLGGKLAMCNACDATGQVPVESVRAVGESPVAESGLVANDDLDTWSKWVPVAPRDHDEAESRDWDVRQYTSQLRRQRQLSERRDAQRTKDRQ